MFAYSISAEDLIKIYPEAIELAKKNGKQPGQDFGTEFFEIAKKYNIKIDSIGETNQDAGLLTGNAREEGLKVLNLNEEMEKRKNKNE